MVLGLGMPEIVIIVLAGGIFFFGMPKVKEWITMFKENKNQAKDLMKE